VHYAASELTPGTCHDLAIHLSPEIDETFFLATNLGLLARDLLDIGLRDLVLQREAAKIKVGALFKCDINDISPDLLSGHQSWP
jgi:hypothetical protein